MSKHQRSGKQPLRALYGLAVAAFIFGSGDSLAEDAAAVEEPAPLTRLRDVAGQASELAMQAIGLLGIHYTRGGSSPENGLDCSGLVRYVFKQAWDTTLPRTSEEISRVGQQVDSANLRPGDLVFYNTLKRGFSHVGIYLGENRFIHSPSSGGQVRIENMEGDYWRNRFNGARRIEPPSRN